MTGRIGGSVGEIQAEIPIPNAFIHRQVDPLVICPLIQKGWENILARSKARESW
ncbi:MAG: hypothetical protein K6U80_01465 [Firmicutes bacterium]|nr:hypothetical protein [Bacillota bacterium]